MKYLLAIWRHRLTQLLWRMMNRYGPSIRNEGEWASMPVGKMVGGVVISTHHQIVGGRAWSITLHRRMHAGRAKFTVRTPEGEQSVAHVEVHRAS